MYWFYFEKILSSVEMYCISQLNYSQNCKGIIDKKVCNMHC